MIDIKKLKALNKPDKIVITEHARKRLAERDIKVKDIINCISGGEIIKQYEDDKPLPSCLLLGQMLNYDPVHVVVSCDEEFIYLITAYRPSPEKWKSDMKTRKE